MQHSLPSSRRRGGLTIDGLYLLLAIMLIALRPLLTPVVPNDFWWHMAVGREIVAQGQIPETDSFSYTRPGETFVNQMWLSQLTLYGLHEAGGVELIVALQALVIALAYGMLLYLVRRRSGRSRLSVVLLLLGVVPISFDNWLVRPQSYALPLFAAFLLILTGYRLRWWRRLWLLPPLMVLWVNLHGSFVLGLALIGLIWLGEALRRLRGVEEALSWAELRRLALWGALTGLATLANPQGLGVIGYVSNLLGSSQVTTLVTEWASPSIKRFSDRLFFIYLIGLAVALIYGRQRPSLTDMLLMGAFLWLALSAVRNIMWFAMVSLPPLVDAVAGRLKQPRTTFRGNPVLNALVAGMVGLLLLLALPWVKPALGLPEAVSGLLDKQTPVRAVQALQGLPASERPSRLYHPEGFGSYLIWAAPEQPVFIDPRIELYPFSQWSDSIALSGGYNVEALLAKYDIDGMLLNLELQPRLADWASANGWRRVYEDEMAVLFVRG